MHVWKTRMTYMTVITYYAPLLKPLKNLKFGFSKDHN